MRLSYRRVTQSDRHAVMVITRADKNAVDEHWLPCMNVYVR